MRNIPTAPSPPKTCCGWRGFCGRASELDLPLKGGGSERSEQVGVRGGDACASGEAADPHPALPLSGGGFLVCDSSRCPDFRDRFPRKHVGALVHFMAGVAFHPMPAHLMRFERRVEA